MNIQDALKSTGEVVPIYKEKDRFSNVYAAISDDGVLCWYNMNDNTKLEPVSLKSIIVYDWGVYTREKEMHPENPGELWEFNNHIFVTVRDRSSGLLNMRNCEDDFLYSCKHLPKCCHSKRGWKLLFSPTKKNRSALNEWEKIWAND